MLNRNSEGNIRSALHISHKDFTGKNKYLYILFSYSKCWVPDLHIFLLTLYFFSSCSSAFCHFLSSFYSLFPFSSWRLPVSLCLPYSYWFSPCVLLCDALLSDDPSCSTLLFFFLFSFPCNISLVSFSSVCVCVLVPHSVIVNLTISEYEIQLNLSVSVYQGRPPLWWVFALQQSHLSRDTCRSAAIFIPHTCFETKANKHTLNWVEGRCPAHALPLSV